MHLTNGDYARSWGYRILAMYRMRKSERPLVVHRFLTWWLIDVCGSSAILLAVHLVRTTIELLQRVSDKYRPTGSNQQEDLATPNSVQLRQTLALWTLASRLPGERPLLETNGDILWTQLCSSGVCSERRRIRCWPVNFGIVNTTSDDHEEQAQARDVRKTKIRFRFGF